MIAVNGYDESKGIVKRFVDRENLKQPILLMGRSVAQDLFEVKGFPTNFWIDHEGKLVGKEVGFSEDMFTRMSDRIERMLRAAGGASARN